MIKLFSEKVPRWLLPAVLLLFVLEIATFPLVLNYTYSDRNEKTNHVLTYTPGKLTWDSPTGIDDNGSAVLDLFNYIYGDETETDVVADDGTNVVAPGTEGFNIVRLRNVVDGELTYTAILYQIQNVEELSVVATLDGIGFSDATSYPLPAGVTEEQVVRAVTGTLAGGTIQDFDISWCWEFYVNDVQDVVDTALGNKIAPDEITVGLYIVVNDDNEYSDNDGYIEPDNPQTGDGSCLVLYVVLMLVSLLILISLAVERRRQIIKEKLSCDKNL